MRISYFSQATLSPFREMRLVKGPDAGATTHTTHTKKVRGTKQQSLGIPVELPASQEALPEGGHRTDKSSAAGIPTVQHYK